MIRSKTITFLTFFLFTSSVHAQQKIDFENDVYPILSKACFRCHQGSDASAGYRLDLRDEILGETNGEPLVKIGDSDASRLIHAVTDKLPGKRMPKNGKPLTPKQIDVLRAWIDQGLAWNYALLPSSVKADHWSFRSVNRPQVPKTKNASWVRNPIDAFIARKHEEKNMTPAPEASRRVLIRRLSLDLLGLPPTTAEIDVFLNDKSPLAYKKLVDRLLASPHYGERWARHWLDVVRWSESEGYESNHLRPYAWRYRDYVVKSFNDNKPFDRFVMEQVAGDELTPYSDDNLIATGFLAAARLSSNEEDKWLQRNDILVDIVNATSASLMGLTMNCAQCHNHKFDPITARDYYRFQAFFLKGQPVNAVIRDKELWAKYTAKRPPEYEAALKLKWSMFKQARKRLVAQVMKKLTPVQRKAVTTPSDQRTDDEERIARQVHLKFQYTPNGIENAILDEDRKLYDELKRKIARMEKQMPDRPQTFAFYSPITSSTNIDVLPMKGFYPLPYEPEELRRAKTYILIGGDVHRRGFAVDVGWPKVFGPVPEKDVQQRPRTTLAKWLTNRDNPLTARVFVNRLWQYHFGRGIVATPNDFGKQGAAPTHPELLDWLADEFMRSGWDVKHIHRLIVTSNTYRQSSQIDSQNAVRDPENHYLWRWSPRRLEAEAVRDSMLAATGLLNRAIGGKSVEPDEKSNRRTLYLLQKRDRPTDVVGLFDGPSAVLESCARRHVSTVPLQALYLLNSEFSMTCAKTLAKQVTEQAGDDRDRQIAVAFQEALGRYPDDVDRRLASAFFEEFNGSDESAMIHFCQVLLNLNEFVYVP